MKIKPLSDRVIVKAEAAEEKTASGIILPDTAKEKPQEGKVVAVGPGKISDSGNAIKMTVKVGDKVLYGKYSGTEVTVGNEEYLIMKDIPQRVWRDYEKANRPRLVICKKDQLPSTRVWRNAWKIDENVNKSQEVA